MKIVVLVKHVPDAQFDRHLTGPGNTTDRDESSRLCAESGDSLDPVSYSNAGQRNRASEARIPA